MSHFEPVDFKLAQATSLLQRMRRGIVPPRPGLHQVALVSSGAILHHEWSGTFNDELTGFLAAVRSIPELIQYRYGTDPYLRKWLLTLSQQEQVRRKDFQNQFETRLASFRKLPLANERNIALHREGVANWEVRVKGRWGEYVGGPTTVLPSFEIPPPLTREDPNFWRLADYPLPLVVPLHTDFWWAIPQPDGSIMRSQLFPECNKFLVESVDVVAYARELVKTVHEGSPFTVPPCVLP